MSDRVWVPRVPTEAMLNAARDWSAAKYGKPVGNDGAKGCYSAMLSAAPSGDGEPERWVSNGGDGEYPDLVMDPSASGLSVEDVARIIERSCNDYHNGHYGPVKTRPERRKRAIADAAQAILAAMGQSTRQSEEESR